MLASLLLTAAQAKDWAVLVAGSNTWSNYRHQADICHAYQVAHKNGIPDERIIVFQYDDLATNRQNPFNGQIFNKPTTGAGVDVYAGCKRDYTGSAVTPQMFIAAITGDATQTGGRPVLQSTADDNVFIFFSDHGATGLIAFPTTYLYAKDLNAALQKMSDKKMFKKLVFYLEACESGSMFQGLLNPSLGIYATTASNPSESSWGCYCPPQDVVNGKELGTCLGDLYSVNWMENTDSVGPTETLGDQYTAVKTLTTLSQVMQYGDLTYLDDQIGNFIGDIAASKRAATKAAAPDAAGIVNSRDIPLHLAYYAYLRANKTDFVARQALAEELLGHITRQIKTDNIFMKLAKMFADESLFYAPAAQHIVACGSCCEQVNEAYHQYCGGYDDYSLQYVRVGVNLCQHLGGNSEKIATAMKAMCMA